MAIVLTSGLELFFAQVNSWYFLENSKFKPQYGNNWQVQGLTNSLSYIGLKSVSNGLSSMCFDQYQFVLVNTTF